MKRSEVKNIVTNNPLEDQSDPQLVFIKLLDEDTGEIDCSEPENCCQPDDWDNVRHLTGNLYLAWDNNYHLDSKVYIGEFR